MRSFLSGQICNAGALPDFHFFELSTSYDKTKFSMAGDSFRVVEFPGLLLRFWEYVDSMKILIYTLVLCIFMSWTLMLRSLGSLKFEMRELWTIFVTSIRTYAPKLIVE